MIEHDKSIRLQGSLAGIVVTENPLFVGNDARPLGGGFSLLDAKTYDAMEAAGARGWSNAVLQAFQPDVFGTVGYPMRVNGSEDLWRYIDVMHEARRHHNMNVVLSGLTSSEFDLFKIVTRIVDDYAQRQFGLRAHATAALLRALHILRMVKIVTGNERPTVLEVGPGCGYLGALLVLEGYPYIATEVTQAFYLYQNHMLAQVASELHEFAVESGNIVNINQPRPGTAIHVPWWKWVTPNLDEATLSVGILTANHMLCEMHPNAMAYLAAAGRQLLSNCPDGGALIFEGCGSDISHHQSDVLRMLTAHGFALRHNEEEFVTALEVLPMPKGKATGSAALNLKGRIRLGLERYPTIERRVLGVVSRMPRLKYGLGKALEGGWSSRVRHYRGDNPLSRRLREGRAAIAREIVVYEPELDKFLNDHFGGAVPSSGDEVFYRIIRTHP